MKARIGYLLHAVAATACMAVVMLAHAPDAMALSKCACKDIKDMERNIGDYDWLAKAHGKKAAELEEKEKVLIKRMGSAARVSDEMGALWDDYNNWEGTTVRADFVKARNYASATVVTFDVKTNKPDPGQLAQARKEAGCARIADSIDRHEKKHADLREGGRAPHDRPSQLAREEQAHYEDGMKFIQDEVDALKKKCPPPPPHTQAYSPDKGQRYAQRERLQRAVNRVSAYAASI